MPKGRQEGAGVRQQPPGERADPAACCTLEPRGTESRAAEVPRGSPGAGSVSAPAACLVGVWGLAAGDGAPRWVQLWAPQTTTCTGEATCFPEAG